MNRERLSENEQQPIEPMSIGDATERYYEVHGINPTYEILRSELIEGHEVAWMKYSGTIEQDFMELGREGQIYEGYAFKCACDFSEGVGWFFDDKFNGPVGTLAGDKCEAKLIAQRKRMNELKNEYSSRMMLENIDNDQSETVKTIILDLIDKSKNNEFLEIHTGANFWGGHYYLQLVESITGIDLYKLYWLTDQLEKEKVISMNGAVVCEHHEPSPPSWEPFGSLEYDGWKVTVCIPTHEKMNQSWKFEVYNPDGELVDMDIPELPMAYTPIYGPDATDIASAEQVAGQILAQIKSENC